MTTYLETTTSALPADLLAKIRAAAPSIHDLGLSAGETRVLLAPTFKVPAGGLEFFEVPEQLRSVYGADSPTVREVRGIFAGYRVQRQMWPTGEAEGDEKQRPLCQSIDGRTGVGEFTEWQPRDCSGCPMKEFGANSEKPKCGARGVLTLAIDGYDGPVFVDASPSSAKAARQWAAVNLPSIYQREVHVTIRKEKGAEGPYGVMEFATGQAVTDPIDVTRALEAGEQGSRLLDTEPTRPAASRGDVIDVEPIDDDPFEDSAPLDDSQMFVDEETF